jgi:hypothetical protein
MVRALPRSAVVATTYARSFGDVVPGAWTSSGRLFGDVALVMFLLAQCFDGVFTYLGVTAYGVGIEANPIIASLIVCFGQGAALTFAKIVASSLGICLYLRNVHAAVAMLTAFYLTAAILPWAAILFF